LINIGDWIRKWSIPQFHDRALLFENRPFTFHEIIEELPKTASGKIQKFILKEWHRTNKHRPENIEKNP